MKIYWHSTANFGPSSYSVLTRRTVPEIVKMGHKVTVGTWYGLQGAPQLWQISDGKKLIDTVQVLPGTGIANYGVDTFHASYLYSKADVAISCMDVWVLPPHMTEKTTFCPWVPIDHDPCPEKILQSLSSSRYTMSMSKWGVDVLEKSGHEAHYVPCSADADYFKPMDRKLARQELGMPEDAFIVSMVAANKDLADRKGFSEALQGFAAFRQKHENAVLYIHTRWDTGSGGLDIGHLAMRCNLPSDAVMRPDAYGIIMGLMGDDYMRNVYNASNVLLNPAKSEGFGLPILEAQMCGLPVAATDFSTTEELVHAGYRIKGHPCWSYGADSWRYQADIDSVTDALEAAYADRDNEKLRQKARNGAIDLHTPTVAKRYWKPALQAIEKIACGTGKLQLVEF